MKLKEIVNAFGVPGFEDEIRTIIKDKMSKHADEVYVDKMGNVIGMVKGGERKVMLAAHMDQIGFMVKSITDEGYLIISPIGGIHTSVLRSTAVRIRTSSGFVYGVIGEKPPHLGKEQKKIEFKDLRVDIGADSKEEAEKIVSVGDVGSFEPRYMEMNGKIVANSLDDRIGVYTLLKVMENVQSDATLYFVATVQEEVGLKGARTSSFGIAPDIGIAVDVTHATMPGVSKEEVPVEIGKGPVLSVGAVAHPKLYRHMLEVAKKKKIPYQVEANPSWSGTDADIIQLARDGVAAGVVSIPERYMHSGVELISEKDVKNTIKLIR
ncbi:MAG: M42 family metallopeptidase, partial [Euryarchaeota archaeon]|nr:M42 family metallopeptidase [Euryarchaeota archaeon]